MRYYEHYLKRLRESFEGSPQAQEKVAILDALEGFSVEDRFVMIQEVERLIRDVDPEVIDWGRGVELVRKTVAESSDAPSFCRRLRENVSNALGSDAKPKE
ncbi:MAG: hypothetical protein ACYTKC_08795 [Planctomycetota bacterium]|jgi:hypothetical protein